MAKAAEDAKPVEIYLDDPASWTRDETGPARELLGRLAPELLVPLVTQGRPLGFVLLGRKLSEEPYSAEDKALLQTVAAQLAIALDYSDLIKQVAEQEKLRHEIEIASQVQQQLFPQVLPPLATLDYCGLCRPARGVGGDYYDFLALGSSQLGIAVGDISGKGISAALLRASLQALLRSHAPLRREHVATLAADLNRLLFESTAPNKYATFFYAVYDDTERTLTYVNAGHNPPLLLRSASEVVQRLDVGGPVIGMFPDLEYRQARVQLERGDVLVIFTDGISEAMNEADEDFGEDRLCEAARAYVGRTAKQFRDGLVETTARFVGNAAQHDDMTLVVARVL